MHDPITGQVERLRALLAGRPARTSMTTRAIQVGARIADLAHAERAAEHLRTEGLLDVQQVGATRLWFPVNPSSPPGEGDPRTNNPTPPTSPLETREAR